MRVCVSQGGDGECRGDAARLRDGELHQPVGHQADQLEYRLQGSEPGSGFREGCDRADGGSEGYPGHHPAGHGECAHINGINHFPFGVVSRGASVC